MIEACPHCDSSNIYQRATKSPTWRCASCRRSFHEPDHRERRGREKTGRSLGPYDTPGSADDVDVGESVKMLRRGVTLTGLGERYGVDRGTVKRKLDQFGMLSEVPHGAPGRSPTLKTDPRRNDYKVHGKSGHDCGDRDGEVSVHRLAAVAWHGRTAVFAGKPVQLSGIPWDVREDNVIPTDESEHGAFVGIGRLPGWLENPPPDEEIRPNHWEDTQQ